MVTAPTLTPYKAHATSLTQALTAASPSLWSQEYPVMREILLLQVATKNYNLEPEERFGAWFQDMELLNENDKSGRAGVG